LRTCERDAAIDDEIARGQTRQHVAGRFAASFQQVAPADLASLAVDRVVVAVDDDRERRTARRRQQRRHGAGTQTVVGVEEQEPFAACMPRPEIARGRYAGGIVADQPQPRVTDGADDCDRGVGRSIVHDDHFAHLGLRQRAGEGFADIGRNVLGGNDHRHRGARTRRQRLSRNRCGARGDRKIEGGIGGGQVAARL
jgi:hypothetical protein